MRKALTHSPEVAIASIKASRIQVSLNAKNGNGEPQHGSRIGDWLKCRSLLRQMKDLQEKSTTYIALIDIATGSMREELFARLTATNKEYAELEREYRDSGCARP